VAGGSHARRQFRPVVEEGDASGQLFHISGSEQKSGAALVDQLASRAQVRSDYRACHGIGFENVLAQGLVGSRRHHGEHCLADVVAQKLPFETTEEFDVRQSKRPCELFEFSPLRAIPCDAQRNSPYPTHGAEQVREPLFGREPAKIENRRSGRGWCGNLRRNSLEVREHVDAPGFPSAFNELCTHEFAGYEKAIHAFPIGAEPLVKVRFRCQHCRRASCAVIATFGDDPPELAFTTSFASLTV